MSDDFRIKIAWRRHIKRRRLKRALGLAGTDAIEGLWAYATEHREDGDLSGLANDELADEADYDGDPDELIETLLRLRLLDGEPGNLRIHDWADHQPWVARAGQRREAARHAANARWESHRAQRTASDDAECGSHAAGMRTASETDAAGMRSAMPMGNAPFLSLPDREILPGNAPRMRTACDPQCAPHSVSNVPKPNGHLAYDELEAEGCNRLGMALPGHAVQKRLRACCPVHPDDWRAALDRMRQKASKPNFGYLAGVLETLAAERRAPTPSPPTRRPSQPDPPKPRYHEPAKLPEEPAEPPTPEQLKANRDAFHAAMKAARQERGETDA